MLLNAHNKCGIFFSLSRGGSRPNPVVVYLDDYFLPQEPEAKPDLLSLFYGSSQLN